MEKKLSTENIKHIDEAIQRLGAEWEELKRAWQQLDNPGALDRAFYKFVEIWLATDGLIDRETHAHTLTYWDDPDLNIVRQAVNSLQVRLSKLDDPKQKQRGIEKLQQALKAIEV